MIDALRLDRGDGYAKAKQIEHSNGRPLAVCIGGPTRGDVQIWLPQDLAGVYQVNAIGCYRVFEDQTRMSSKMWPQLCPDCRKGNRLRAAKRAFRRRAAEIAKIKTSG